MSRTGGRNVCRKVPVPAIGFGHQGRHLQGGDAKPQSADILTQKTGAHFFVFPCGGRNAAAGKRLPELPKNQSAFSSRVKRRCHDGEIEKNQIAIITRDRDEEEGKGKKQCARQEPCHGLVGR